MTAASTLHYDTRRRTVFAHPRPLAPFGLPDVLSAAFLQGLLRLPAVSPTAPLTLGMVLRGVEEPQRLRQALEQQPKVRSRWQRLRQQYAVLGGVRNRWPEPAASDVVERVQLSLDKCSELICCADGRRYARDNKGTLMTEAEFRALQGVELSAYLDTVARERAETLTRAAQIMAVRTPATFRVDAVSRRKRRTELVVQTLQVKTYLPDQLDAYLRRTGVTALDRVELSS